jgi:murein DD-endopeptidase MepM/ murein hydrolase activator NlpD
LRPKQTILKYRSVARLKSTTAKVGYFLRNYLGVHQSLVLLTLFILISNAIVVHAANSSTIASPDTATLDPYQAANTVRVIAPYMHDIQQDPDAIATTLEDQVNGTFIASNTLITTVSSDSDSDDNLSVPTAQAASAPTERTNNINYTVKIGDTLSAISTAYGLHVATLLVKNNLANADAIKPGQVLVIPPEDLSSQAIAAATSTNTSSNLTAATTAASSTSVGVHKGSYGFIVPIHYTAIAQRLVAGHTGIDYDAPVGTPVYAAASGTVMTAEGGWNGGYGLNVLVNIGNNMTLRYAHLSKYLVSAGQQVTQGELIAYSGDTGRSTGPHLHFELRVDGVATDPGT